MIIVWGRKITRRTLGYVVDFCPICRALRTCALQTVHSSSHVYYISLGGGQLLGYERKCEECGTSYKGDSAAYASVSRMRLPFDELKQLTCPHLNTAVKGRLELEERIRTGRQQLSAPERYNLIREPFLFLSPQVERRFARTHVDAETGLAIAAAVALMFAGTWLGRRFLPDSTEVVLLVAAAVGAGLIVWQFIESGTRFMRRKIVPVLAKSLQPLEPTSNEIERVLDELKRVKQKIGRKLKVSELLSSPSGSSASR